MLSDLSNLNTYTTLYTFKPIKCVASASSANDKENTKMVDKYKKIVMYCTQLQNQNLKNTAFAIPLLHFYIISLASNPFFLHSSLTQRLCHSPPPVRYCSGSHFYYFKIRIASKFRIQIISFLCLKQRLKSHLNLDQPNCQCKKENFVFIANFMKPDRNGRLWNHYFLWSSSHSF